MIGSAPSVKMMDLSLKIDGVHVNPSSSVRNLGVLFDSSLYFASHISSVVKTSFFHLLSIARLRSSLTLADAEILTHALITSRLDYCNALFLGLPKKIIARLKYVQNSAARVLTSNRHSGYLWHRIHFKKLFLTFKTLNGLVPPYLPHILYSYSPPSDHLSLVFCPFPRYRLSTVRGRSFSVNAPKVWNSLPLTLRNLSYLSTFKTQLCVCIVYLGVQMFCLALCKVTP